MTNTKKRMWPLAAAVSGSALLLGSTFALWTANDVQDGGSVTNGNLDVVAAGAVSAYDVSSPRHDATVDVNAVTGSDGHTIADLEGAWNMVPGDVVEINMPFDVAMQGDNLVADISGTLGTLSLPTGVSVDYEVFVDDGVGGWTSAGSGAAGSGAEVVIGRFAADSQANGSSAVSGQTVIEKTATDGTPNVQLVLTVTFDSAATGSMSLTSIFGDAALTATQVRV